MAMKLATTARFNLPTSTPSQMDALWMELEAQDPRQLYMPRKQKQWTQHEFDQRYMTEVERRAEVARLATVRRQRCHNHQPVAYSRRAAGYSMPTAERQEARSRLYSAESRRQREKAQTGLGHLMANGELAPPAAQKAAAERALERAVAKERMVAKSKAQEQAAAARRAIEAKAAARRPKSATVVGSVLGPADADGKALTGITARQYFSTQWKPSRNYHNLGPAKHAQEWQNLDGFGKQSRAIALRDLNPHVDICTFTINKEMTPAGSRPYVRPMDVKGQLGARPVQVWKEDLRLFGKKPMSFNLQAKEAGAIVEDDEMAELRAILGA